MQDRKIGEEIELRTKTITIQSGDQLSIIVSSKNPELAILFNLPRTQPIIGNQQYVSSQNQVLGYLVDSKGNIDFPILGTIRVAGLSREEIAKLIKDKIISSDNIKDPVVTVDFLNLRFSVIGEVAKPGQFLIVNDRLNILEAISMAGDLTIFGKRDRVFLTRTINNKQVTYQIDLRKAGFYNSPAFSICQNDMIYVEPNSVKANQSTINGNSSRSVSLWMSIASFLTTIGVLIFK